MKRNTQDEEIGMGRPTTQALRKAEAGYTFMFCQSCDCMVEIDLKAGTYEQVAFSTEPAVRGAGKGAYDPAFQELLKRRIFPEDRALVESVLSLENLTKALSEGQNGQVCQYRALTAQGKTLFLESRVVYTANEKTREAHILTRETSHKQQRYVCPNGRLYTAPLRNMCDVRYRIVLEQTGTIVFEWMKETNFQYIAPRMAESFAGNYDGRNLFTVWLEDDVICEEDLPSFRQFLSRAAKAEYYTDALVRLRGRQGSYIWCKITLTFMPEGNSRRVFGTLSDVNEAMCSRQVLKYRAEYDDLTGIYNERTFYVHARQIIASRYAAKHAIIRMDINRFKFINDLYGIAEGDKFLKYIAATLRTTLSEKDAYGRMNSDIFCFCVSYKNERELIALVDALTERIAQYSFGHAVFPSFGICTVDDPSVPVNILCDWANLAVKTIKGNLIKKWAFYDDRLRAKHLYERKIEHEMEKALRSGQFVIYLQPKHDIGSGDIIGAEALVRWKHPEDGIRAPSQFIPLFEKNGFVVRLDEYVWESTCKLLRKWLDAGCTPIPISMNISRIHIYNPGFEQKIIQLIEKYDLPSQWIELELTESTFIENSAELYKKMSALQENGFKFSMDDFGAGYSSLNMLKNTPINTIKLDREFLSETAVTKRGQTVIQHMISMARELKLQVIAEGVETALQAEFLARAGCVVAQGFYFSRPMPVSQFERWHFKREIEERECGQ